MADQSVSEHPDGRKLMFSKFSVKKPFTVLVGVILVIVLGVVSFMKMTTDLLPNISLPYVIVMTTYPGASPETVEAAVTEPIEASMATVSNIDNVSSVSAENYSIVILEFAQSTDMNGASLEIRENLDQITANFDDAIGHPIIMKLNPDMLPVMIAAAGVDGMDRSQVSAYVKEHVVPELESIEGVASVSATGLLEESVNVIISQDKIDEMNQKVFAAIDDKMADSVQELDENKQKLEDSKQEIADGKKDLASGRKEVAEQEQKLEDGKQELTDKQAETAKKLAEAKRDLLTAKSDLESTKMTFSTNLTTAREMNNSITAIDSLNALPDAYMNAWQGMLLSVSGGDAAGAATYQDQIDKLKQSFLDNSVLKTMATADTTGMVQGAIDQLKALDWKDPTPAPMPTTFQIVYGTLKQMVTTAAPTLTAQRDKLADSLNAITNSMGFAAYENLVNSTIAKINENLVQVNDGIVEAEKGQLTAAIELANANAAITLGEYQIEAAKTQMDAAQTQLETGEDQLADGEEQLADGEKQLADAKEDAYEKADLTDILTVDMVKNLLVAQNFSMPAGYVTEEGISFLVRVGDKPSTLEQLEALPLLDLHMDGVPVTTLADVADVFFTDNSADIYTNVNGSSGVMLTIQKQTGYSTGEVSDLLAERFDQLTTDNPDLTMLKLMDQGIYIDLVMNSIMSNIFVGGALAILILILFLKDWRPTLVVAVSIPISVVAAIVCMYFSGVTLNVISLSGLALGIGMLVDNSIVVIENIYRMRHEGMEMREAAIAGAKEVAGAIAASTLTTVCVFLPIVFTEGITRQLFVDMGLTIAYSLLASLVIALTVVPSMASVLLTRTKEKKEGRFFTALVNGYAKVLKVSLQAKPIVFLLVLIFLAASGLAAYSKGTAFMPDMDSTQLTVNLEMPKDSTLKETGKATDTAVQRIMELEDVENVGAMAASSNMSLLGGSSGGGSTTATTIYVVTKEKKSMSNEELGKVIEDKISDLGATVTVDTSSMDMSALGGSGVSVQVEGRDLDTLQQIAAQVAEIMKGVEGTANVSDGLEDTDEELRIVVDRNKAVEHGLTVAQVFNQIYTHLQTSTSATTLEASDQNYGVFVSKNTDEELTREALKNIQLDATDADGAAEKIPLDTVADFETAQSLNSINRASQVRYIAVSAEIADGYNVGLVSDAVKEKLSDFTLPSGYQLEFTGENEMITDAMSQLTLMLLLAVIFIYLIMVAQFQSLLSPFIIMFTIPLAFTGGFMGLFLSNSPISVVAMIGFVMLAGVIVNNGIVLVDYVNQLRERGMEKKEALIEAGRTRLRPVLMTALTTILAMSTMVFSQDMGSEMAKPMAVVTIGGLLYGTLLTLVVVPCLYDVTHFDHKRPKKKKEKRSSRKTQQPIV
jgi:HAE1 family hydrophobic/amphiphilic exporter-1